MARKILRPREKGFFFLLTFESNQYSRRHESCRHEKMQESHWYKKVVSHVVKPFVHFDSEAEDCVSNKCEDDYGKQSEGCPVALNVCPESVIIAGGKHRVPLVAYTRYFPCLCHIGGEFGASWVKIRGAFGPVVVSSHVGSGVIVQAG